MDERQVANEARLRRALSSLDEVAVTPLAAIRARHAGRARLPWRAAGALAAAALVMVVALALGDRLNAWRIERTASGPTASAGAPALDSRYGFLVQLPGATDPGNGTSSGIALVDESGTQLMPAFDGLVQAKTSPDGRYIALLRSGQRGLELSILDGVNRSLGAILFTTTERFTRVNEPMVWASDSSAIVLSTTADDTARSAGDIQANVRAIDRAGGAVRLLLTYRTFTFQPLGWDRAKGAVLARAVTAESGGKTLFLRVSDDGKALTSAQEVDDTPVVANDAATYVASFPTCTPGPCRRFVIHDAATYAVVAQIDLASRGAPLTTTSANWAVLFRPRSSDVLVYFSHPTKKDTFGIALHPDAGRGARRDLGELTVAARSDGTITSPNGYFRADGSAVFYVHPVDPVGGRWSGALIDVATAARAPVTVAAIRAAVVVDATVLTPQAAPTAAASVPPRRTLPPDDPSLKGCIADWSEGYRSLPPLVDRAAVIVRATVLSSQTTSERWGVGYRTTLRVDRVLKGAPAATITVVESACPVVYGGPSDWVLFLAPKLDDPSVLQVPGGIHGAFPLVAGRVAPIYRDAFLVRTYTGVTLAELERDIGLIRPIDGEAAALVRSKGWSVAGTYTIRTYELPAASAFGETQLPPRYERPFEGYARISALTGLDLRPFAGREVEEIGLLLERVPSPDTPFPPVAHLVYVDRRYVGGWVRVGALDYFRLEDRAEALAATPRAAVEPTPAPNRYPGGVNVVAEYGLAQATSSYVKPIVPGATVAPGPAVSDLVAALDRTLATEAVPPRRSDGFWVVGFLLGEQYVTFEYHPDTGQLVQRDDGYAIRPDASFAALIGVR